MSDRQSVELVWMHLLILLFFAFSPADCEDCSSQTGVRAFVLGAWVDMLCEDGYAETHRGKT